MVVVMVAVAAVVGERGRACPGRYGIRVHGVCVYVSEVRDGRAPRESRRYEPSWGESLFGRGRDQRSKCLSPCFVERCERLNAANHARGRASYPGARVPGSASIDRSRLCSALMPQVMYTHTYVHTRLCSTTQLVPPDL